MFSFGRKKQARHEAKKEAEIQDIRQETFDLIDNRVKRLEDTNRKMGELLLDDKELGTTGRIFLATGGDRRGRKSGG